MSSIIIPLEDDTYEQMRTYGQVNWSAVARDEARKKRIFEEYMKTHEVTDEDWKFCEAIDWHPVDELPLKKSFIKHLEKIRKNGKYSGYSSVEELKRDLSARNNVQAADTGKARKKAAEAGKER